MSSHEINVRSVQVVFLRWTYFLLHYFHRFVCTLYASFVLQLLVKDTHDLSSEIGYHAGKEEVDEFSLGKNCGISHEERYTVVLHCNSLFCFLLG